MIMSYRNTHPQFVGTFDHYPAVPVEIIDALWNYFAYGFTPGSFTVSILCNDFMGAACHAHPSLTTYTFRDIAKWLINTAPYGSYGNAQAYRDWLKKTNEERLQIMIDRGLRPHEFDILRGVAVP